MLLLTVVYDGEKDEIIKGINQIKRQFESKGVNIGISENIEDKRHFIRIYCDKEISGNSTNKFYLYVANIVYNILVKEFYSKYMVSFLRDTYFFLKNNEIMEIKELSLESLASEGPIVDETSIYYINKKNIILDKIIQCIIENKNINIDGFITFRMKELKGDIEGIIDRVVEKYIVEKEYNEFINLLKYFVEIQEPKIACVNIIIDKNSNYILQDENGKDIKDLMFTDLFEEKLNEGINSEDMIISGLITNSPEKIIIHCRDNCNNKEIIDTIKKVFTDRVEFCTGCTSCKVYKNDFIKI